MNKHYVSGSIFDIIDQQDLMHLILVKKSLKLKILY
jgi:hypothetical protein